MRTDYERAKEIVWDRDYGRCQAERRWPEIQCAGRLDPHHIRPTGQYPELRSDPDNMIVLCRAHHMYAHEHPIEARELGFIR